MKNLLLGLLTLATLFSADISAAPYTLHTATEACNGRIKGFQLYRNQGGRGTEHVRNQIRLANGERFVFDPDNYANGTYHVNIKANFINDDDTTNESFFLFVDNSLPAGFVRIDIKHAYDWSGLKNYALIHYYEGEPKNLPLLSAISPVAADEIEFHPSGNNPDWEAPINVTATQTIKFTPRTSGTVSLYTRAGNHDHLASFILGCSFVANGIKSVRSLPVNHQAAEYNNEVVLDTNELYYITNNAHADLGPLKDSLLVIMDKIKEPRLTLEATQNAIRRKIQQFNDTDRELFNVYKYIKRYDPVKGNYVYDKKYSHNALDNAAKTFGPKIRPAIRGSIFGDFGRTQNIYDHCKEEKRREDERLPDDIFYVDEIFVRIWELIEGYEPAMIPAEHDRNPRDREHYIKNQRDVMATSFIKALSTLYDARSLLHPGETEAMGDSKVAPCNPRKLKEISRSLQGYIDGVRIDPAADALTPDKVVELFFAEIEKDLQANDMLVMAKEDAEEQGEEYKGEMPHAELKILGDAIAMELVSQQDLNKAKRYLENRFAGAEGLGRLTHVDALRQAGIHRRAKALFEEQFKKYQKIRDVTAQKMAAREAKKQVASSATTTTATTTTTTSQKSNVISHNDDNNDDLYEIDAVAMVAAYIQANETGDEDALLQAQIAATLAIDNEIAQARATRRAKAQAASLDAEGDVGNKVTKDEQYRAERATADADGHVETARIGFQIAERYNAETKIDMERATGAGASIEAIQAALVSAQNAALRAREEAGLAEAAKGAMQELIFLTDQLPHLELVDQQHAVDTYAGNATFAADQADEAVRVIRQALADVEAAQVERQRAPIVFILAEQATAALPYYINGNWVYGPKTIDTTTLEVGVHKYTVARSGKGSQALIIVNPAIAGGALKVDYSGTKVRITMRQQDIDIVATANNNELFRGNTIDGVAEFEAPYGDVELSFTLPGQDEPLVVTYKHNEN